MSNDAMGDPSSEGISDEIWECRDLALSDVWSVGVRDARAVAEFRGEEPDPLRGLDLPFLWGVKVIDPS